MWQHAKHGVAYLLGGEDRPEDSRDIDAPQGTYAWLRDNPPDWSVYINQTLDMIGAINNVCRRSNCQFVLSAIPAPWQVSAAAADGPGVRTRVGVEEQRCTKAASPSKRSPFMRKRAGFSFVIRRKSSSVSKSPRRLYRRNAARFSAMGHDLYARVLGRFVEQSVPGPWGSGGPHGRRSEGQVSTATGGESGSPIRREGRVSALDDGSQSDELHTRAVRPVGFTREASSDPWDEGDRTGRTEQRRTPVEESRESKSQSVEQPAEEGHPGVGRDDTGQGETR